MQTDVTVLAQNGYSTEYATNANFRTMLALHDAFGDDFERFESGYGINMPASKVGARLKDWSAK